MANNGVAVENGGSGDPTGLQTADMAGVFRIWDAKHTTLHYDPVPVLTRLAELFEEESQIFLRKDPDPFDERHPSRTDPECELGRMLKLLFRKDQFMIKLMNDYLRDNYYTRQILDKSSFAVNVAACRLVLVIMPGLETNAVFQDSETLINRLYSWAENSMEPLQSYATGLLAAAMDVPDITTTFREQNGRLIPIMLSRLATLQRLKPELKFTVKNEQQLRENSKSDSSLEAMDVSDSNSHLGGGSAPTSPASGGSGGAPNLNKFKNFNNLNALLQNELNSNTQDSSMYMRNVIPYHPPTTATSQMLILRYLTSMGEYQEFMGHAFENSAMSIIMYYIDFSEQPKDSCLAFEALKYLASLLCHKKFALEFVNSNGLDKLLLVPRPSITATGVSVSLYYLAYCEDAMERICMMQYDVISNLVSYVLWLLGSPHDSGRCHATMFFGLCLQFKVILDEFDRQDGFRKLYNVISVLPLLSSSEELNMNDDEECAARQLVRHVVMTMRKYLESHLYFKYSEITNCQGSGLLAINYMAAPDRADKCTLEVIGQRVTSLQESLPFRTHWLPVHKLLDYGGVTLLLKIIAMSHEWNYTRRFEACRVETVKSALDILSICCVIPKVLQIFCERVEFQDLSGAGITVILHSADKDIVSSADVQKSALAVLVHCVCAPIHRSAVTTPGNRLLAGAAASASKKKGQANRVSEEIMQNVWESVRSNNGIIVLLSLMHNKGSITDADCIRGMACRALAGLARCDTVRQIVGKLPLFTNGELRSLMRDPILQEKRVEHVQFQKYARELMERVSGKAANSDVSLADIHRANVVAQTRIQYNEQQLLQLIHQELLEKGLVETAATLQREANLTTLPTSIPIQRQLPHLSPYTFRSPSISRNRLRPRVLDSSSSSLLDQSSTSMAATTTSHLALPANSSLPTSLAPPPPPPSTQLQPQPQTPVSGTPMEHNHANHCDDLPSLHTPIKLIKRHPEMSSTPGPSALPHHVNNSHHQRSLQKSISIETSVGAEPEAPPQKGHNITLSTIITEYLKNQHALCKHPMSTCSQFDLFKPHKCPDPRPNKLSGLCLNFADRFIRRDRGIRYSRHVDRRLVHSNFNVSRIIRSPDNEAFFTCSSFSQCGNRLAVGTYPGEVKMFNLMNSEEEFSFNCHESSLTSLSFSRCGKLMLTSTSWAPSFSSLWQVGSRELVAKWQFNDEEYCEFANMTPDWILGTKAEVATIFDINTGQTVQTFKPTIFNQYSKNRATFCPTDELILCDGVLWDVKAGVEIHKFDKLNQAISGVFHPNNLAVVSNTEVWDLRTFHLLQTVPSLDQCRVVFSPQNVIYAITSEPENQSEDGNLYECSYKVLDAYDYSSIATFDVKKSIQDIAVDRYGLQIAVIENQGGFDSIDESAVRIYNVGGKKHEDNNADEEDEDETDEDESDESIESMDSETDTINGEFLDNLIADGGNPRRRGGGGGRGAGVRGRNHRNQVQIIAERYARMFANELDGSESDNEDEDDDDEMEDGDASGGDNESNDSDVIAAQAPVPRPDNAAAPNRNRSRRGRGGGVGGVAAGDPIDDDDDDGWETTEE